MGVITKEFEVTLSIPAIRLLKSLYLDAVNIVPKVLPYCDKLEILEGDGGAGSIRLITYVQGDQVVTSKQKIEERDEANYVLKYTIFEGDVLGEGIEYFKNTAKIEPGSDGTCVLKYKSEFHVEGDGNDRIHEKIKQRLDMSLTIVREIESYLVANPGEYN